MNEFLTDFCLLFLKQILKKVSSIETNILVTNHKILMMETRLESCVDNQKAILGKLDHIEKELKNSGVLSPVSIVIIDT